MKRTFLDACVLLRVFLGTQKEADAALKLMDDDTREFVSSDMLKMELLPYRLFSRKTTELEVFNEYFDKCVVHVDVDQTRFRSAFAIASQYGLQGMDAMHVDAARHAGASELVTYEKITRQIHTAQSDATKVVSFRSEYS